MTENLNEPPVSQSRDGLCPVRCLLWLIVGGGYWLIFLALKLAYEGQPDLAAIVCMAPLACFVHALMLAATLRGEG